MSDYELKVPEGTAALVQAHLTTADPDELASLNRYSVRKGETLLSISRKLKVSRSDLADANYLKSTARLSAGQQLIIPREPTALLAARTNNPVPVAESRSLDAVVASRAVAPKAEAAAVSRVVHRVKRGETLASIARLYRTSVASLKQWNKLRSNALMVGQRLTIFPKVQTIATN
jgi:membrane-bound lytic murein transglycosylase D